VSSAAASRPDSLATATLKPREVEELVDFYVHRRLALALVALVRNTSVTPNQITAMSGLLGIAAGLVIGIGGPRHVGLVPLGGVLLLLSVVFDCADGQLARLRGSSTLAGRALDGIVDVFPIVAVQFGFAAFLIAAGLSPWYVLPTMLVAGLCWRWHAEAYDCAKCLYMANTSAEADTEGVPDLAQIEAERDRLRAEGRHGMALCVAILRGYTAMQRKRERRAGFDEPGMQTDAERAEYRRIFAPSMRAWSWTGIGTHHFLMMLAAFLTPVFTPSAVVAWWSIILAMSVLSWSLQMKTPRLERRLADTLAKTNPAAGPHAPREVGA